MKIKNIGLSLAVTFALGLGICGCGSSSDTSSTATETGTIVDAPVNGLYYTTATQSGYTNDKGEFKYVAGETVEFRLGNLSLGTAPAGSLITPYTLGDSNTTNPSDKTTNIAMLLQSFDGNRSDTSTLDLSKLKDYKFTDVNLSATTDGMARKLNDILIAGDFANKYADGNTTAINATTANSIMKSFVQENSTKYDHKFTTSYLSGKTFFIPALWAEKGEQGEKTIVKMTFTDSKVSFYGYDNDPDDINQSYTIIDGTINIPYVNVTLTATSIDDEGVSLVSFETAGQATKAYFDKETAQNALLSQTKKFTDEYIAGRTVYAKYQGKTDVETLTIPTTKISFTDENQDPAVTLEGYGTDKGNVYRVVDGKVYQYTVEGGHYNDGINIFTITSVDDDKITCSAEIPNETTTAYLYFKNPN